jgi:hypothetical protein
MSYNVQHSGVFKFKRTPNNIERAFISSKMYEIGLELTSDKLGLMWDGCERGVDPTSLQEAINEIRADIPDFELCGELLAQGEEIGDLWKIVVDGHIVKELIAVVTFKEHNNEQEEG